MDIPANPCQFMQMPLQSILGSSDTTFHANPQLPEFEAMDLDAQLAKLEKLVETPSKAKSKAVDEGLSKLKIW